MSRQVHFAVQTHAVEDKGQMLK